MSAPGWRWRFRPSFPWSQAVSRRREGGSCAVTCFSWLCRLFGSLSNSPQSQAAAALTGEPGDTPGLRGLWLGLRASSWRKKPLQKKILKRNPHNSTDLCAEEMHLTFSPLIKIILIKHQGFPPPHLQFKKYKVFFSKTHPS